uniref:WD_REPEATS_REGION domain-containing protein n=1 Tax=Rhabditophanes sp. KR3021 TaxID=114890 RepID=A0AC35TJY8_9BILA
MNTDLNDEDLAQGYSYTSNPIVSAVFSQTNGEESYGLTGTGSVYYWNLTKKGDQHVFGDKGCVKGSVLAISPNDQFLAVGSNTGFVNVYSATTVKNCEFGDVPGSIYSISNLVTDANVIVFDKFQKLWPMDQKTNPWLLGCLM